ncbi:MAG: MTH1187 family thiamine-binding protein [Dehalococcoidia bacterium]
MKDRVVVAEISVVPLGTGSAGVSEFVAACIDVLEKRKNVSYRLTPMGTILQGPLSDILEAAREMHNVPFQKGAMRVVTTLKIDDRLDKRLTMEGKIKSVVKRKPETRI